MSDTATAAVDSYVGIEDPTDPGTFIDVSEKATNARLAFGLAEAPSSTFGSRDVTAVNTMRSQSFNVDFLNDEPLNELLYNCWQSPDPTRVRYGPQGDGAGKERYTADFNIGNFEIGGAVDGLNQGPASFTRTGPTTRDTF